MRISILGSDYTIRKVKYDDDPYFKEHNANGFCDSVLREIVIGDIASFPGWEKEPKERMLIEEQLTLRHEIVHAFLDEAGLQDGSLQYSSGWAKNEEMVDWFAIVGPKIFKAWQEAGCFPARV